MTQHPENLSITRKIRFLTLGPQGSNHQYVTYKYLEFHGLTEYATVELVLDFFTAAQQVIDGKADHIIQVAVHPSTTDMVAKFRKDLYIIDAFVSGSKDMAVIVRKHCELPQSVALQPATREYMDLKGRTLIPSTSTASVAEGLLNGEYDCGLTYSSLAFDHPDEFEVEQHIGTVDDAWIVYGREPVALGQIVSWQDSPAAKFYKSTIAIQR